MSTRDPDAVLALTMPADIRLVRDVRKLVRSAVDLRSSADETTGELLELVVAELVTNAVEASTGDGVRLDVNLDPAAGEVELVVANTVGAVAAIPPRATWGRAEGADRGRGLFIVDQVATSLELVEEDGAVTVHVRLPLQAG